MYRHMARAEGFCWVIIILRQKSLDCPTAGWALPPVSQISVDTCRHGTNRTPRRLRSAFQPIHWATFQRRFASVSEPAGIAEGTAFRPETCVPFAWGESLWRVAGTSRSREGPVNRWLCREEDPDSFVRKNPDLNVSKLITDQQLAFPMWYANKLFTGAVDDPVRRNKAINLICSILVLYQEESQIQMFVDALNKKYKIVRATFHDKIKELTLSAQNVSFETDLKLPSHVKAEDFQKFGYYEDKNQYHFNTKDGIQLFSNFVMKPLFLSLS